MCLISRSESGHLIFADSPLFFPNQTPQEILEAGSFGGTYFRPIFSSVTRQSYGDEVWKELPENWIVNLDPAQDLASSIYRKNRNRYKVKCGSSLEIWESSGWIHPQDPYGWFQWYCRFFQGRRSADDERQILRWQKCAGPRGRWRTRLIKLIKKTASSALLPDEIIYKDTSCGAIIRQILLHWAYEITLEDLQE